jgi:hypothetical protein
MVRLRWVGDAYVYKWQVHKLQDTLGTDIVDIEAKTS